MINEQRYQKIYKVKAIETGAEFFVTILATPKGYVASFIPCQIEKLDDMCWNYRDNDDFSETVAEAEMKLDEFLITNKYEPKKLVDRQRFIKLPVFCDTDIDYCPNCNKKRCGFRNKYERHLFSDNGLAKCPKLNSLVVI